MVQVDDLVEILRSQRNAAMDEIVRQGALIRDLQRQLNQKDEDEKAAPSTSDATPPG